MFMNKYEQKLDIRKSPEASEEPLSLTKKQKEELELIVTGSQYNWDYRYSEEEKQQMRIEAADGLGISIEDLTDVQAVRFHGEEFYYAEVLNESADNVTNLSSNQSVEEQLLSLWRLHE